MKRRRSDMPRRITWPRVNAEEAAAAGPSGRVTADAERWKTTKGGAALFVAAHAADTDDCRRLLDMLGLLRDGDLDPPLTSDTPNCSPRVLP